MRLRLLPMLISAFLIQACGGSSPAAPTVAAPSTTGNGDTLTGTERLGWEQPAADSGELASFHYVFYVDAKRTEAEGVSCAANQSPAGFTCTSALPAMEPGVHTLQVAAFILDGNQIVEGDVSASLQVTRR